MKRAGPLLLAAALACAADRAAPPPGAEATLLHAPELARVRCLLVAPLENGSDVPAAAEAATQTLVRSLSARTGVFPLADLRALFHDTPLELPAGAGPALALELAGLLGADAALHGAVEGRALEGAPELAVTLRLTLAADRRLLFARTLLVAPAPGERTDLAVRRAVEAAARPVLSRLGDAGGARCFDPERVAALRRIALAEAPEAHRAPSRAAPRTPRQAEWARRLAAGERVVVEDVTFAARSADLARDAGLADLAAALAAEPGVAVRLEGFVDATSDPAADEALSRALAQAALLRLVDQGVARGRLSHTGRGGESPRLPNFTARGRAANRRVEAVPAR